MFKIPPLQAYTFAFFVIAWGVDLGLQYKRSIFHSQAGLFKCLDTLMSSSDFQDILCWVVMTQGAWSLQVDESQWFFVNYQVKVLVTR